MGVSWGKLGRQTRGVSATAPPGWLEHLDWQGTEWSRVGPEFLGSGLSSLDLGQITEPTWASVSSAIKCKLQADFLHGVDVRSK